MSCHQVHGHASVFWRLGGWLQPDAPAGVAAATGTDPVSRSGWVPVGGRRLVSVDWVRLDDSPARRWRPLWLCGRVVGPAGGGVYAVAGSG